MSDFHKKCSWGSQYKPLSLLSSDLFTDKMLVVLCTLGNRDEIKTRLLLNTGAIGIKFIDKKIG